MPKSLRFRRSAQLLNLDGQFLWSGCLDLLAVVIVGLVLLRVRFRPLQEGFPRLRISLVVAAVPAEGRRWILIVLLSLFLVCQQVRDVRVNLVLARSFARETTYSPSGASDVSSCSAAGTAFVLFGTSR